MSIIKEYIKLIPKALGNPEVVISSWLNVIKEELGMLPEDQLEEILRRRLICGGCHFMSDNLPNYKTDRKDKHCTLCGCPILAKTAGLQNDCGAKDFNERHPELPPQEVKWNSYESRES